MLFILFLVFVVTPIVELAVIVQVAGSTGVLNTIGLLVLVSVVGAWLVRREGLGLGVRGIRITDDRGSVAGALVVSEGDDLFAVTTAGMIIRMPAAEISVQGRDATGVRVMSPGDGQEVTAVSPAPTEDLVVDGLPEAGSTG